MQAFRRDKCYILQRVFFKKLSDDHNISIDEAFCPVITVAIISVTKMDFIITWLWSTYFKENRRSFNMGIIINAFHFDVAAVNKFIFYGISLVSERQHRF